MNVINDSGEKECVLYNIGKCESGTWLYNFCVVKRKLRFIK